MKVFILFMLCLFIVQAASGVQTDTVSLSVADGDSVTLHTYLKTHQRGRKKWYFNDTRIAQMTGDQSKICMDGQCKDRFGDRLRMDSHTGDLTITNISITDSGEYKLQTIGERINENIFNVAVHEIPDKVKRMSVKQGESVTLDYGEIKWANSLIWHFHDIPIAEISGDQSQICTDDQCHERFTDRLKLDHQTGSLTITNTDAGDYKLQINNSICSNHSICVSIISIRRFSISFTDASVLVKEGDSVFLDTGEIKQQDRIRWYFNNSRIAQITGAKWKICSDVKCEERFRDRLKLNHQTGSLTITDTRSTDTGEYKLQIIRKRIIEKVYTVSVLGVPAAERDEVKTKSVNEGGSVTLNTGVIKTPSDQMVWYFEDILIVQITGDQMKICPNVQCEDLKNRLKLDHQTGSLAITNTRRTDSGDYKLKFTKRIHFSISITSIMRFTITVTDSSLPADVIAAICVLLAATVMTSLTTSMGSIESVAHKHGLFQSPPWISMKLCDPNFLSEFRKVLFCVTR